MKVPVAFPIRHSFPQLFPTTFVVRVAVAVVIFGHLNHTFCLLTYLRTFLSMCQGYWCFRASGNWFGSKIFDPISTLLKYVLIASCFNAHIKLLPAVRRASEPLAKEADTFALVVTLWTCYGTL